MSKSRNRKKGTRANQPSTLSNPADRENAEQPGGNDDTPAEQAVNWERVFSGTVAAFTALLFVTSTLQWCATEKQIEIARGALEVGQRAWVLFDTVTQPVIDEGPERLIQITFKNFGTGPAFEVVTQSGVMVVPATEPIPKAEYDTTGKPPSLGVLAPNSAAHMAGVIPELSAQAVADIQSDRSRLYVFAQVTYTDIFKRPRRTERCLRYDPRLYLLTVCSDYNSAE